MLQIWQEVHQEQLHLAIQLFVLVLVRNNVQYEVGHLDVGLDRLFLDGFFTCEAERLLELLPISLVEVLT